MQDHEELVVVRFNKKFHIDSCSCFFLEKNFVGFILGRAILIKAHQLQFVTMSVFYTKIKIFFKLGAMVTKCQRIKLFFSALLTLGMNKL
jgi:hypothetical protein